MRLKTMGALAATGVLALPAAGLAARNVKPTDGTYTGGPHYTVAGKSEKASLTITVAKRKITAVTLLAAIPPKDTRLSKGPACGSANDYTTKGYKRAGTTSASGQFNYTFTSKSKTFSDKITVVGRFTDSTHARGVWRDVMDSKASRSHCDTGKVSFSVAHT